VPNAGRGAPLLKVEFRHAYKHANKTETFIAPEGVATGQFLYCGVRGKEILLRSLGFFLCVAESS
jgi:hypothetical protein